MPDKSAEFSWSARRSVTVQWWFRFLVAAVFVLVVFAWVNVLPSTNSYYFDFVFMRLNVSVVLPQPQQEEIGFRKKANFSQENLAFNSNSTHQSFLGKTHENADAIPNSSPRSGTWISTETEANYSSNLLSSWLTPKDAPCKSSRTVDIRVPALESEKRMELSTAEVHEFEFQAVDGSGEARCLGGDYFETDLSGESWKTRPPVKDFGNGTYSVSILGHSDFSGEFNLTIILLFRDYEGLKFSSSRFVFDRVLRVIPINFVVSPSSSSPGLGIALCKKLDFTKTAWSGRWTRHVRNDTCDISDDGRFRCQEPTFSCRKPWCYGELGRLESNGWVYSSHCSFELFSSEKAWRCLSNRWIFWWGDSNHCDTIRNLLHFVLDVRHFPTVPRIFDANITNPRNESQIVRFTSIFNGHQNETGNYQGLNSLSDQHYRESLKRYFSGEVVPDAVILNSGLHDGIYWPTIRSFIKGADFAASFWKGLMEGVGKRGMKPPEIIYRTTVATGGYARSMSFNPQKMEAFNGVLLDKLRQNKILDKVIDDFDMTFPWHFDNRCNDGVHYGRAPAKSKWKDGQIGHQYFVDLMLGHVILNALCA